MIFFPTPFMDELLYSVLARYYCYSGSENSKKTMDEVFNSSFICASLTLPSKLKQLCANLPTPDFYTPNQLIKDCTLLPYFSPFIPEERYMEIRDVMTNYKGSNLYMKLGMPATTIKSPNCLRYCIECIKEDDAKYGEIYWHRAHQVEGVIICHKHDTILVNSNIPYSQRKNKHKFHRLTKEASTNGLTSKLDWHNKELSHLRFIAEQTYYLLQNEIAPLGQEEIRKFYIAKLQELNLATVSGRIRWINLTEKFNKYFGSKLLLELECYINAEKEHTWLHKLLRKPRVTCHPLRHILLLGFLGETIQSLVNEIKVIGYLPFGNRPWPCLNKAADHFHKLVVKSCIVTRDYKTKKPVGTFSCFCGFIYSRKGPDTDKEDRFKIGLIKEFGSVWELKLIEVSKMKLSLRKKAELLGVDPKTVKNRLNLVKERKIEIVCNQGKDDIRNQWTSLLQTNIGESISEIRAMAPNIYIWLYRNDREWLNKNYPVNTKNKSKVIYKRIDWEQRDKEIAKKVKAIAKEILQEDTKLIRITKNEIGRRFGRLSWLYKNLEKMPETKKEINNVLESIEQFQIRRIKKVISEMKKTNSIVKDWEVIRKAGLNKRAAEKLKSIIQNEI
ncbi:TnsD family transposase [Fredinandcohnia humi]